MMQIGNYSTVLRGRTANKILFPFNSADVPGVSRPIDLCDFDAEISFKGTELCVSTGFCCVIYMGFFCRLSCIYMSGIRALVPVPCFLKL